MDRTLELADIHTACFLILQDIDIVLINRAGRVYFVAPAEERTYKELVDFRATPRYRSLILSAI